MKNGFTLIELLAVIVILAIIALIATPIVLGIINDSKNSATIRSAGYYIEAVKHAIMKKNLELQVPIDPKECTVMNNSYIKCDEVELLVEVEGELPDSGFITFESGKTMNVNLVYGDRTVIKNSNGELVLENKNKLAPGLYDENDNLVVTWEDLTSMDYQTIEYEVWDYEYEIYHYFTSAILNVDENGVLTSAYDGTDVINYSAEYLEGKLVIPEGITSIGEGAFTNSQLTSVEIPDSVTSIGDYAFHYNQLTSVVIPDSVTSIGEMAFSENQLTSVTIGNSVTYIGASAFAYSQLTSVVIGNSVTSIGSSAFSGNQLTNVLLPDSIKDIGDVAFSENQLISVVIPVSLETIGNCAFCGNPISSVVIKGKTNYMDFLNYDYLDVVLGCGDDALSCPIFGWAEGYSDDDIIWQP